MITNLLRPGHIAMIAIVWFIFFGAKDLPEMGRALGQAIRGFKEELTSLDTAISDGKDDEPL